MSNNNLAALSNQDLMKKISENNQNYDEIKLLTSSQTTDQLKVFLIAQARNELTRIIKLTQFLDRLESNFINKADKAMTNDELTLKQYSDVISVITGLLSRSNDIISSVLKDDSLTTILNTTIYTSGQSGPTKVSSVVSQLKDPQSREKVRIVLSQILSKTEEYVVSHEEIPVVESEGVVIENGKETDLESSE